ncbi:MAG: T9SS type A sorting domain-containing protein [Crocinitomicaceae bacterium]
MKFLNLIIAIIICTFNVQAATITVTNTNDSGLGSLRQATIDALEGDTIRFDSNIITPGSDTIKLVNEIIFNKGLVIKGLYSSTDTLYISGENSSRIFSCNLLLATHQYLKIDSLVLMNGNSSGNGGAINFENGDSLIISNSIIKNSTSFYSGAGVSADFDAAIFANSTFLFLIENSIISGNNAGTHGGGVYSSPPSSYSSSLVIKSSSINNNTTVYSGGGTFSNHPLTVENSIINSNTAGAHGGGAFSNYLLNIENSTINGNTATEYGGGVCSYSNLSSSVIVENSTISGNVAGYNGGGLHSLASSSIIASVTFASVDINNSTISGNSAGEYGGGINCTAVTSSLNSSSISTSKIDINHSTICGNHSDVFGGGVYSNSSGAVTSSSFLDIENTTISGNTAAYDGEGLFSAAVDSSSILLKSNIIALNGTENIHNSDSNTIISQGYNIFNDAPVGYSISQDQINVDSSDLNLLPLTNNGGSTQTMVPGLWSIAINAGNPNDNSDAQNKSILGVREAGAAEVCYQIGTDTRTECDSVVWLDGNTYTSNNNTAYITFINGATNGCDSALVLDLTIINSATGTDTRTECGSLLWLDGNTYTSNDTTATYIFTGGAANGCDSVLRLDLTIDYTNLNVTRTNWVHLNADQSGATYQWLDCNNNYSEIIGETSQTFIATVNGAYAVEITKGDCVDTTECTAIIWAGLEDESSNFAVIYPNPITDIMTFVLPEFGNGQLEILNLHGKIVLPSITISSEQTIDIKNLESGIYFVRLTLNGSIIVKRIVKL